MISHCVDLLALYAYALVIIIILLGTWNAVTSKALVSYRCCIGNDSCQQGLGVVVLHIGSMHAGIEGCRHVSQGHIVGKCEVVGQSLHIVHHVCACLMKTRNMQGRQGCSCGYAYIHTSWAQRSCQVRTVAKRLSLSNLVSSHAEPLQMH